MTAHITVVGSLNMDLVARAPRIPQPSETIIGGDFHTVPGGKGANQAVAVARLGAQVAMVGRVGRDAFAKPLLDNLDATGVDHTFVIQDPEAATGVALIVVDDAGQNSIVVASGANMRLSPADVDGAETAIASADALLLQLESPLDTVIRAAEIARAHGVTVILNPAPAHPLPAELLAMVDVLIPNESETALLTGLPVGSQAEAEAAATALRELGVGTVILTLGERGALLAREKGAEHFPAFDVTPVDTTAAGDAFVGGFAVALAEGRTLAEAVRWGNGAGGLATTKLGAQPSLPTRQDLEALLSTEIIGEDT
ncbi:MAG: ribokinase [Anaerolineae bacterium]